MFKFAKKALAIGVSLSLLLTILPTDTIAAKQAKSLKVSKKKITMEVGDRYTIKSKGEKANLKVKISPKKANQSIKVKSSDSDVVKVNKIKKTYYRLTAMEEGKAIVTISSVGNKKLKQKIKIRVIEKEEDQKSTEKSMTIRQSAENQITVNLPEKLTASIGISAFKLNDKTGNSPVALSKVILNDDMSVATIESAIELNSGSQYELTFTNPSDGKIYIAQLNSSKGEVTSIKILTTSVPINVSKKIKFAIYDNNNVDVTASNKAFVSLKAQIPSGKGYFDENNNELRMLDNSVTAKIIATYMNGSKKVEGVGEISVTSESTESIQIDAWTLDQKTTPVDWKKTDNPKNKSLGLNTRNMRVCVKLKTSDGKEIKSDVDNAIKFESTDNSIFTMSKSIINPVSKGTASVIVKYTYEGKESKFTPIQITIGDDSKPSTMILSGTSTTVKSTGISSELKVESIRDQYGNEADVSGGKWNCACVDNAEALPTATCSGDKITINGNSAKLGSYNFRIEFEKSGNVVGMMFSVAIIP